MIGQDKHLIELAPCLYEVRRPWPAAIRVAILFLASGICWAMIIGLIIIIGALGHG